MTNYCTVCYNVVQETPRLQNGMGNTPLLLCTERRENNKGRERKREYKRYWKCHFLHCASQREYAMTPGSGITLVKTVPL